LSRLDALREGDFLLTGEQRAIAHLAEIGIDQIARETRLGARRCRAWSDGFLGLRGRPRLVCARGSPRRLGWGLGIVKSANLEIKNLANVILVEGLTFATKIHSMRHGQALSYLRAKSACQVQGIGCFVVAGLRENGWARSRIE
jgi:hypothetical protein